MSGMPVEQVLKRGNWSTKSIWQKFYNKNTEEDKALEKAVLINVGTLKQDAREMCYHYE